MLGHVNSAYSGCSHGGESLSQIFRLACLCWGLGLAGNARLLLPGEGTGKTPGGDLLGTTGWLLGRGHRGASSGQPPCSGALRRRRRRLAPWRSAHLGPSSPGSDTCVLFSQPLSFCPSILGGAQGSPAAIPTLSAPSPSSQPSRSPGPAGPSPAPLLLLFRVFFFNSATEQTIGTCVEMTDRRDAGLRFAGETEGFCCWLFSRQYFFLGWIYSWQEK